MRIIVPSEKYHSESLSPGVELMRMYPGGKNGPNGELAYDTPGGQGWTHNFYLGDQNDAFQMMVPDIRLPANQIWPLHWHDCWTAVVVIEGTCLIGDWWMQPGDVFITEPSLEYGPMLIGPNNCRLFEIFAHGHLARGGYAPEYRDHPTLQGTQAVFAERSALNKRNDGRQILPCDNVDGVTKSRLAPGQVWDLGDSADPERSVMKDTRLTPKQRIGAQRYDDWHAKIVLAGTLQVGDKTLSTDDVLLIQPGNRVDAIEAGADGAHLLELSRTARSMTGSSVD